MPAIFEGKTCFPVAEEAWTIQDRDKALSLGHLAHAFAYQRSRQPLNPVAQQGSPDGYEPTTQAWTCSTSDCEPTLSSAAMVTARRTGALVDEQVQMTTAWPIA